MDVILCEKPSQGRAYAAAVGAKMKGTGLLKGNGFIVTWCLGHIVEQAEPHHYDPSYKKWSYDALPIIPQDYKLLVVKDKKPQFKIIADLLKKATRVFIATDFDREGEAIAREVMDLCKYKGEILRIKCSSYEASDIRAAMKSPIKSSDTIAKYYAQQGRSRADWLLGMNLSRAFGLLYQSKLNGKRLTFSPSVGRVQTPLLNIISLREKALWNFKPENYYHIEGVFNSSSGSFLATLNLDDEFKNEHGGLGSFDDAEQLGSALASNVAEVTAYKCSIIKANAPLPYTPSKLNVDAEKLNITTSDTKTELQKLYEAGYVTYPRTDNGYLPKSMIDLVPSIFGHLSKHQDYQPLIGLCDESFIGQCWNDVDAELAAHHGIIPTVKYVERNQLPFKQLVIYDLICKRFLQQFMGVRELEQRNVEVTMGTLLFKKTVKAEIKPGWTASEMSNRDSETNYLPPLTVGENVICDRCNTLTKTTTKPKRFTEASLVIEMGNAAKYVNDPNYMAIIKKSGLGTEATQGDILNNEIRKKNIVIKSGKVHLPVDVEDFLSFLPQEIKSVDTTSIWEEMLKLIEHGELPLNDFMAEIETFLHRTVENYKV
ncbi:MAG: DNA topoisomerase [Cocleimonas sp.]